MTDLDLPSDTLAQRSELPPPSVLRHVIDVHCHPTDTEINPKSMDKLPITICAMATRVDDQAKVADLAAAYPEKVIPCFGYHPWFTHWISLQEPVPTKDEHYRSLFLSARPHGQELADAFSKMLPHLPDPIPLSSILTTLRQNLIAFPTALLGEVGLDRSARVPVDPHATPRVLSPFTIPIDHQVNVLEAQLALAVELKRNVSLHSVKAQQITAELLKETRKKYGEEKWDAISVDMHSCGLSAETWKDIEKSHPNVFLSLSTVINTRSPAHRDLISVCSPYRILAESDIHDVEYCAGRTWDMIQIIAEIKGWTVEKDCNYGSDDSDSGQDPSSWGAVRKLEENWKAFTRGDHQKKKDQAKTRTWVTGGNRKARKRAEKARDEWISDGASESE